MNPRMAICLIILGAFAIAPTRLLADEPITVDNFVRAETDYYLTKRKEAGYFGNLTHGNRDLFQQKLRNGGWHE